MRSSRFRLAITAWVALIAGLIVAVGIFVLQVQLLNTAANRLLDTLGSPFIVGGPVLLVLAAIALVVRLRIPQIAAQPRDTRSRPVVVLTLVLSLAGAVAVVCVISALDISETLVGCTIQEC